MNEPIKLLDVKADSHSADRTKFSPNGRYFGVIHNDNTTRIIETNSGNSIYVGSETNPYDLAFGPNNEFCYFLGYRRIGRVNLETGEEEESFYAYDDNVWTDNNNVYAIDVFPDGEKLAYVDNDGHVKVIKAKDFRNPDADNDIEGTQLVKATSGYDANQGSDLTISSDGKHILYANNGNNYIEIFEFTEEEETNSEGDLETVYSLNEIYSSKSFHSAHVSFAKFNEDDTMVVSGDEDGVVTVWDFETKDILYYTGHFNNQILREGTFIKGTTRVLLAGATVSVWDYESDKNIYEFSLDSEVKGADSTTAGEKIVLGSTSGEVEVYLLGLPLITRPATNVDYFSMTLNGELLDMGPHDELECYFEYSTDPSFETNVSTTTKTSVTSSGNFSSEVTELDPGSEYFYRALADPVTTT